MTNMYKLYETKNMVCPKMRIQASPDKAKAFAQNKICNRTVSDETATVGHWHFDIINNRLTWSIEMFQIYDIPMNNPVPHLSHALSFMLSGDQCLLLFSIDQAISISGSFCVPLQLRRRNGSIRPIICSGTVAIIDGKPAHLFGAVIDTSPSKLILEIQRDATEMIMHLMIANRDLECLVLKDSLTGIGNRRRFDDALPSEIENTRRTSKELALILIDVDNFKSFNDNYGHAAGDRALRTLARLLNAVPRRAGDFVARIGGEEFAIVLPSTGITGAIAIAETVRSKFETLSLGSLEDRTGILTISLGVAVTDSAITTVDMLFDAADQMLYRAKNNGRNRIGNGLAQPPPVSLHVVR